LQQQPEFHIETKTFHVHPHFRVCVCVCVYKYRITVVYTLREVVVAVAVSELDGGGISRAHLSNIAGIWGYPQQVWRR
jgi:hypothetical protein